MKAALLLELESGRKAVELLGTQAVLTGAAQTPKDIAAAVDSVSTGDVRNVNIHFNQSYTLLQQDFSGLTKSWKEAEHCICW